MINLLGKLYVNNLIYKYPTSHGIFKRGSAISTIYYRRLVFQEGDILNQLSLR
jgi:hypothetical protein